MEEQIATCGKNLPESQDSEACNHGSAREGTLALGIHVAKRSEDVGRVGTGLTELLKAMREDVQAGGR